jgi:Stress responsive A/B Barrel Domain
VIRHVVMWRLGDPTQAGVFRDELMSCAGLVPGTWEFSVGIRSEALAATADVCLVANFTDAAALAAYHQHPHHVAVSARLTPMRVSRDVLDFEVGGSP